MPRSERYWQVGESAQAHRWRVSSRQPHAASQARLIEEVLATQTAVLRALHDQPVPAWLSLDLTIGELKALFLLFHAGPILIGAQAADRGRTLAQLAPIAHTLMGEPLTGSRERLAGWLRQPGPDDLASLTRDLRALAEIDPAAHVSSRNPHILEEAGSRNRNGGSVRYVVVVWPRHSAARRGVFVPRALSGYNGRALASPSAVGGRNRN